MTLAIVHPGQMGATVAAIASKRTEVLWCPTGRSVATQDRAERAGLVSVADFGELLDRAEMVLSICPPAAAEEVANDVARHSFAGIYVDANAVSPARSLRMAETLSGAVFVDAGIIGPPPSTSVSARLHLSGPAAARSEIRALFADSSLTVGDLGERVGQASALKMAFASFQKASRALAAVSHALAAEHEVSEELVQEANRLGSSALSQTGYFPSLAARAWRWAPEMREIADTLAEAQIPADFAIAAEKVLKQWDDDKDQWDLDVNEVLAHLRDDLQEDAM